jgi:multisubunit Na+/H+ antiporter MnhB subunit
VRRAYTASTFALSALILLVGIAMILLALARGGGALALGVVVGVAFAVIGAGRLWLARDMRSGGGDR